MNFKKNIFFVFYSVILFIFLITGFLRSSVSEVKASPSPAPDGSVIVSGYAWSDTIGWIEFDPSFGGVFYDLTTKKLSGYAWSDNIGWIKFDGLSSYPDSLRGSVAVVDTNGFISGWARACAGTVKGDCSTMESRTDGWDGWISLSRKPSGTGTDYGVKIDLVPSSQTYGDFSGYAWGSDVVGWIKFNCQDTPGECAQSNYRVRASLPGVSLEVSCVAEPSIVSLDKTVLFTAKAFGGTTPYSYVWTGNDGLSGTTETVSKSYSATGTKNATVEVKDAKGVVKINSCFVSVIKKPINPSYKVSPSVGTTNVGQTFQFTGIYNSDKTSTEVDITEVTKSAKWQTTDISVATIVYEGSTAGLATCKKEGTTSISSTYRNGEGITFEDKTATLNCLPIDPPDRTLTVNIVGQGTVDGLIGICSQASCNKVLNDGTSGYLRATPAEGYTFSISKWSGACSQTIGNVFVSNGKDGYSEDDNICDPLAMSSNKTVTVVFEKKPINPSYKVSPRMTKIKVGEKSQFRGEWSDGEHYPQDKTAVAEWKVVDSVGNNDNSIATFTSVGLKKGEAKCISVGTAYIYSSYGGLSDTAELICENISRPKHTLTVTKIGDGYGEITGAVECDIDCLSESAEYPEGSIVEITATSLEGSTFREWLGACASVDENDTCELAMTENKNATASFTENTYTEPKAYISADDTDIKNNQKTTVRWMSDDATRCVNEDGDPDDGWVRENDTEGLTKGSYQTTAFGQNEERNYEVACYDDNENSDYDFVSILADSNEPPIPSVDLIAVPDDVETGEKATLSWISSDIKSKTCVIVSADDSNFYASKNFKVDDFGSVTTGVLDKELSEYSYTITCVGDDDSFVEDEVVIETKEKPCVENCVEEGAINIEISDITATIVAGLPTKTQTNNRGGDLVVSGSCDSDTLVLMADFDSKDKKVEGEFVFNPESDGAIPYNGKFSVKNIKGTTEAGIYPITIKAACKDKTDESEQKRNISATKTINLIIKKILSGWEEN